MHAVADTAKRRRKRHRKSKHVNDNGTGKEACSLVKEKTDQNLTSDNGKLQSIDSETCNEQCPASGTHIVPIGTSKDVTSQSEDVVFILSKNQKRKLKKKRRKEKGKLSTGKQEPFVYIDKKRKSTTKTLKIIDFAK